MFTVSIIYSQNITGGLTLFHLNRCSVANGINIVNLGAGAPLNLNFCLNISNTKKYWGTRATNKLGSYEYFCLNLQDNF